MCQFFVYWLANFVSYKLDNRKIAPKEKKVERFRLKMERIMKNLAKMTLLALVSVFFVHCSKDDKTVLKEGNFGNFNFVLEKGNSSDSFISKVVGTKFHSTYSTWGENVDGTIYLTKSANFHIYLANGDSLNADIYFRKTSEDKNKLLLIGENSFLRDWEYLDLDVELNDFYRGFDEARISIGNNVKFVSKFDRSFRVTMLKEVVLNSKIERAVRIKFSGSLFGWFDPNGEHMEVYTIRNGSFMGVL